MNNFTKNTIIIVGCIILCFILYPPWLAPFYSHSKFYCYAPIWNLPNKAIGIAWGRFLAQSIAVIVIGVIASVYSSYPQSTINKRKLIIKQMLHRGLIATKAIISFMGDIISFVRFIFPYVFFGIPGLYIAYLIIKKDGTWTLALLLSFIPPLLINEFIGSMKNGKKVSVFIVGIFSTYFLGIEYLIYISFYP